MNLIRLNSALCECHSTALLCLMMLKQKRKKYCPMHGDTGAERGSAHPPKPCVGFGQVLRAPRHVGTGQGAAAQQLHADVRTFQQHHGLQQWNVREQAVTTSDGRQVQLKAFNCVSGTCRAHLILSIATLCCLSYPGAC